jgi:chromate reductase
MAKLNLAVIVGSNRRDSINRKLAHALARLGSGSFEANFLRIDDLPMFNQDLESSLPAEVVRYKAELARADGVLIVTPEHDRSIPAVLKNAIDWGARTARTSGPASPLSSPEPRRARSAVCWHSSICAR